MAQGEQTENARIPHACLISAPVREQALKKARELAAAAVCGGEGKKPCGRCRDCRKAAAGVHPDIIAIRRLTDEKGRLKQNIVVDQIRELSADAVVLPNEAARKVYILEEAELMNGPAQNAALKLLEEPPEWTVFLLCTENAMLLLPTVRSRCALYSIAGEADEPGETASELAVGYLRAVNTRDAAQIMRWCAANENTDAQTAAAFLEALRQKLADLLSFRRQGGRLSRAELMRLCTLSERCTRYLKVNTSVKHLFGLLAVDALPDDEEPRKSN